MERRNEVAPPGWSGTVKAMLQRHPEIDNPYALAWSMKNKGNKPHYKPMPDDSTLEPGTPRKKKKYEDEDKPKKRKKRKDEGFLSFREWLEVRQRIEG